MSYRARILEVIAGKACTALEIAEVTGISERSVKSAIANLIYERKIVFTESSRVGRKGRPPLMYSIAKPEDGREVVDLVSQAIRTQPNSVFSLGAM